MKITFTVKTEFKAEGYTTLGLVPACDDPDVQISLSEGKFFITTPPDKVPLVQGDIREMVVIEEVPEEPV